MNVKSKSGFSLVELMVVVAIIGVLATVAVPNYMKFQAKAKQSSAKSELAGIYTAEKAFFVEYSSYLGSLPAVGFVPEGMTLTSGCPTAIPAAVNRYYQVGFNTSAAVVPQGAADTCGTATAVGAAPAVAAFKTHFAFNGGSNGLGNVAWGTAPSTSGVPAGGATFTAAAHGAITAGSSDIWTISETNVLNNARSGL